MSGSRLSYIVYYHAITFVMLIICTFYYHIMNADVETFLLIISLYVSLVFMAYNMQFYFGKKHKFVQF